GTVETGIILPIPATIFSPALRIHVTFDADHGRGPWWRLGRRGSRNRRRTGGRGVVCRAGAWGLRAAWRLDRAAIGLGLGGSGYSGPAKLFRGGVEQIVGLVRRLGLRPFIGNGRFLAGLGVRSISLSGRAVRLGRCSLGCDGT